MPFTPDGTIEIKKGKNLIPKYVKKCRNNSKRQKERNYKVNMFEKSNQNKLFNEESKKVNFQTYTKANDINNLSKYKKMKYTLIKKNPEIENIKTLYFYNDENSNIYNQNININNNLNHLLYIQSQATPNRVKRYLIQNNNDKNNELSNHIYHEIYIVNEKKHKDNCKNIYYNNNKCLKRLSEIENKSNDNIFSIDSKSTNSNSPYYNKKCIDKNYSMNNIAYKSNARNMKQNIKNYSNTYINEKQNNIKEKNEKKNNVTRYAHNIYIRDKIYGKNEWRIKEEKKNDCQKNKNYRICPSFKINGAIPNNYK